MYNLKFFVGAVGICAALFMAGCGSSAGNDSSSSYDSSVTKEDSDAEDGYYVEDDSYEIRQTAPEGSLDTIDGKYQVQGAEGVCYYFDGNNTCYYVQQGTYSFSHDINTDGDEVDMIAMQFDTQSAPTYYTMEKEDEQLALRTTYSGEEAETIIAFDFIKGMDKITEMEMFEGIYSAYSLENYRYEFHSDGTFYLVLEEAYSTEDSTLTLSAFGKELIYDYAAKDGNMELSNGELVIATLVPGKE